ncbi:MAG: right-handed parallel beta-helix repeat-containing protein [Candidatus Bathyarchaeota archaeon]|nr:right-handed parallel beta-helix repeat-containing protein [Candidatus Bathyarchaeota archaeon]
MGNKGTLKIIALCIACLLVGVAIGIYITVPPNAPDYVISQQGRLVVAENSLGIVAFSGADASQVINDATHSGNSVYIKSGTYNLTAPIVVFSNSILIGEGTDDPVLGTSDSATRLVRSPTLNGSIITGANVYNVLIKTLSIDGARINSTITNEFCDGVHFDVIKRSRLEGIAVYDCMGNGICLTGSGSIENRIVYCSVRHNNMNGILQQLQSDSSVYFCEVGGNGYDGLRLYTSGNNLVEGCTVFLNKGCGIQLADAQQNRILGNRVNTNYGDGIRVSIRTESASDKNIISQNTIYDNGYRGKGGFSGIALVGGNTSSALAIHDCVVSNNEVFNTKDWGQPQSFGIREYGANIGNLLLGNACTNNTAVNIRTVGATTQCASSWNGTSYISGYSPAPTSQAIKTK